MKPFARLANRTWIGGILVAFLGVALTRLVAPRFASGTREWLDVAGQIIAFAGLFIIAYGIKRRRDADTKVESDQG